MRSDKATESGARLKELRKDRKFTQSEVAKALDWSQADISQLEAGKRALTIETAFKLAKLFDCSIEDFRV